MWFTPTYELKLPTGETLLKPGRPVMRAPLRKVAKWFGVSTKTLTRLAECGLLRCARPTPRLMQFYPAEVAAFIQRTEDDPEFWTRARKMAFLSCRSMREKS